MTQSNTARPNLFIACSLAFAIGTFFLLGCNPLNTTEISTLSISSKDDDESSEKKDKAKKENEMDLLKSMEKPLFALFVTGRQFGYIEPCGCTGLYNQKGGLMRRHRVQQILSQRGWELIPIDAGNQIRRFGQQPVIKLQHTWQGLCKVMNYAAIGFGPDDLKAPTIDLVQTISNIVDDAGPFVSANVDLMGAGVLQNQFIIVEKAGKKIGITHVLDDKAVDKLKDNDELVMKSMDDGIKSVTPQMAACDLKVLMLRTEEVETAQKVAKDFPAFDIIIHTTSAGEPEKLPTKVTSGNHTTKLIQIGTKGMYVGIVGCYAKGDKLEIKYERVPLDGRFTDSKLMEKTFESYQNELKILYTSGELKDIKPQPHPSGNRFVGSQACFDCHQDEFEIWEDGVDGDGGPHFIATDDIVDPPNHRGHIARHFDPECISCHATGWHPQDFYPYETGFVLLKQDSLHGNGCENCHGPGSAHVELRKAENKGKKFPKNVLDKDILSVRLTLEKAKNEHCGQCHDADNSPDFLKEGAFEEYWEKIEH